MMDNKALIDACRIYKGEKENPYTGKPTDNKAMIWYAEKLACNDYLTNVEMRNADTEHYVECGLLNFIIGDGVPIIFKVALLRYYEHYFESGTKGFKEFYLKEYIKESD